MAIDVKVKPHLYKSGGKWRIRFFYAEKYREFCGYTVRDAWSAYKHLPAYQAVNLGYHIDRRQYNV